METIMMLKDLIDCLPKDHDDTVFKDQIKKCFKNIDSLMKAFLKGDFSKLLSNNP